MPTYCTQKNIGNLCDGVLNIEGEGADRTITCLVCNSVWSVDSKDDFPGRKD